MIRAADKPFTIAVMASGTGTNFRAILNEIEAGRLNVRVGLLVSDRPQSGAVAIAKAAGVPVFAFRPKDYPSRAAYEAEIVAELRKRDVDLVVLAGYMRLVTETLLQPFAGRIVNIHPSLLPAFPGVDGIGQALRYGVKVTGVTVHFVDSGLDTGPIIAQRPVEVLDGDTEETLAARIHAVEHELYPQVIRWLSEGRVNLDGRLVTINRSTVR